MKTKLDYASKAWLRRTRPVPRWQVLLAFALFVLALAE